MSFFRNLFKPKSISTKTSTPAEEKPVTEPYQSPPQPLPPSETEKAVPILEPQEQHLPLPPLAIIIQENAPQIHPGSRHADEEQQGAQPGVLRITNPLPNSPGRPDKPRAGRNIGWENVYVFISSTFNDMHAERDYLVKQVFPELREWCEQHKLNLIDIDLRWGVTEQDATQNKRVIQVCLDRIDACRPFFLCFLGQRRGWVPENEDVFHEGNAEDLKKYPELAQYIGNTSATEIEILHALVNPLHRGRIDDNDKVLNYEPTKHAFFYLRKPEFLAEIPPNPIQIRRLYTNEEIENPEKRHQADAELKRWREVEIPRTQRPVRAYTAHFLANEETPEICWPLHCPSSAPADSPVWRMAYNRWKRLWSQADVSVGEGGGIGSITQLEKAIQFNKDLSQGRLGDFKCEENTLAEVILFDLKQAILERFPEHVELPFSSALQREIDQQGQFVQIAGEGYIYRAGDFDELDAYVQGNSNQVFALTAHGGQGKSTLLANWIDHLYLMPDSGQQSIHFRFIGVSDGSTTVNSLLKFLLQEIRTSTHKLKNDFPQDPQKLREALPKILEEIGRNGKTLIILDGLNQLESGLADLSWLPLQLPVGIKLVVSFKSGQPDADELTRDWIEGGHAIIKQVNPFETLDHRRQLVKAYLSKYLKNLDEALLDDLISLPGAANPLYLKVVLSELRVFGVFGELKEKIKSDFGQDPISAFRGVLRRLESDPTYSEIPPQQAVPLLFGLLAHARHGLSVDELTAAFISALQLEEGGPQDAAVKNTIHIILRQVRPYLARRDGSYDFFFESLKLAALEEYDTLSENGQSRARTAQGWHFILAEYFESLPTWQISAERQPTRRKVSELPYHQIKAGLSKKLIKTLSDLEFLEAKITAGMFSELLDDYQQAGAGFGILAEYERLLRSSSIFLQAFPQGIYQKAANLPDSAFPSIQAREYLNHSPQAWFRWLNKPTQVDNCHLTLALDSADQLVDAQWSKDEKTLIVISGKKVSLHNASNGQKQKEFINEIPSIDACFISADSQKYVLAYCYRTKITKIEADNEHEWEVDLGYSPCKYTPVIKICNLETGRELLKISGHHYRVKSCALSRDGKYLAAGSTDRIIRLYDAETGAEIRKLEGHSGGIVKCTFSPDGKKLISFSSPGATPGGRFVDYKQYTNACSTIVWNVETGEKIDQTGKSEWWLFGLNGQVQERIDQKNRCEYISVSQDGKAVIKASGGTTQIIDLSTGAVIDQMPLSPQTYFSQDGRMLLSVQSGQKTIKIWAIRDKNEIVLNSALAIQGAGESSRVSACAMNQANDQVVYLDQIGLKVISTASGERLAELPINPGEIHDSGSFLQFDPSCLNLLMWGSAGYQIYSLSPLKAISSNSVEVGQRINDCSFSPDGKMLMVSCSSNGKIVEWRTGRTVFAFENLYLSNAFVFSPDGRFGGLRNNRELRIFDLYTLEVIAVFPFIDVFQFTPDGKGIWVISTMGGIHTLKLLAVLSGIEIAAFPCKEKPGLNSACGLLIAPDNHLVSYPTMEMGAGDGRIIDGSVVSISPGPSEKHAITTNLGPLLQMGYLSDGKTGFVVANLEKIQKGLSGLFLIDPLQSQPQCVFFIENGQASFSAQKIVAGIQKGQLFLLETIRPAVETPVATALRRFDLDLGTWSSSLAAICPTCRKAFHPTEPACAVIDQGAEVFFSETAIGLDNHALSETCPNCGQGVKLNSFTNRPPESGKLSNTKVGKAVGVSTALSEYYDNLPDDAHRKMALVLLNALTLTQEGLSQFELSELLRLYSGMSSFSDSTPGFISGLLGSFQDWLEDGDGHYRARQPDLLGVLEQEPHVSQDQCTKAEIHSLLAQMYACLPDFGNPLTLQKRIERFAYHESHLKTKFAAAGEYFDFLLLQEKFMKGGVERLLNDLNTGVFHEISQKRASNEQDGPLVFLRNVVRSAGEVLGKKPEEFASQLEIRLLASSSPEIKRLQNGIWQGNKKPRLRPTTCPIPLHEHPFSSSSISGNDICQIVPTQNDGNRAALIMKTGIKTWNAGSATIDMVMKQEGLCGTMIGGNTSGLLAVGQTDLFLMDLKTNTVIREFKNNPGLAFGLEALGKTGELLVSIHQKTIKTWNANTGEEVMVMHSPEQNGWLFSIAAVNEKLVAVGCQDGTIRIWDVIDGREVTSFKKGSTTIRGVAVVGERLAVSADSAKSITIWNLKDQAVERELNGNRSLACLGENYLISGYPNLQVWDLRDGSLIASFTGKSEFYAIAGCEDGKTILGCQDDCLHTFILENYSG